VHGHFAEVVDAEPVVRMHVADDQPLHGLAEAGFQLGRGVWQELPVNDCKAARTLDDMRGDPRPPGIGEIGMHAVPALLVQKHPTGKADRCNRATLGQRGTRQQIGAEGSEDTQHRIDLQRTTRARYSSTRCGKSRHFSNWSY
jgi:hypothetical protein